MSALEAAATSDAVVAAAPAVISAPSTAPSHVISAEAIPVTVYNKRGVPLSIPQGPTTPCNTLYIRNLPERKGHTTLKRHLLRMFEQFGRLLAAHVHRGIKKRGQAWIVFQKLSAATAAFNEMQNINLYGKRMVVQYAKMKSKESAVLDNDMEAFMVEREKRFAERKQMQEESKRVEEEKQASSQAAAASSLPGAPAPVFPLVPPFHMMPPLPMSGNGEIATKVLLVTGLPPDADRPAISTIFGKYVGFCDVRPISGKADAALVDYDNVDGAIAAQQALHLTTFPDSDAEIQVTFHDQ